MALFDSIKGVAGSLSSGKGILSTVQSLADPKNARMAISGLLFGGSASQSKQAPNIGFKSAPGSASRPEDDWRVRISLSSANNIFYNDASNDLMKPLAVTNGVVFPYTPSISVTHQAMYNSAQLTHSNYAAQFYQGSEVNDITITGDFTVQTAEEGQYLLAAIYFFRSATKMFFGFDKQTGNGAGNPPPIVYLDGYGEHYFPHVSCVVTGFTHNLPNEVDYIDVPVTTLKETTRVIDDSVTNPLAGGNYGTVQNIDPSTVPNMGRDAEKTNRIADTKAYSYETKSTRLPTASSISITLRPVYSRKSLHEKFNLNDFAAGKLVKGNGGFL
jgi:hypothetical protein